jgi:phenylacetate-CoA ligase
MSTDINLSLKNLKELFNRRISIAENVENVFHLDKKQFEDWQQERLLSAVKFVGKKSPHYNCKFSEMGIEVDSVTSMNAFSTLPFTTRSDIMGCYPMGLLASPIEDVVRYGESTGTTGNSISAYFTADDWIENNCTVSMFLGRVLSQQDIVAVAVPYELAGVGQDLDRALELVGCVTIAIGALTRFCPPERMVEILRNTGATTLICSGTRAIYLADIAIDQGYDIARDFKIKRILCVGEGMSKSKANKVKAAWGANIFSMYGMTETNTLAMFCPKGHLHLVENRSFFEVVDPETGESLPPGSKGELVVTPLNTKGMPLIRYKTGDLVAVNDEPCECGFHFRRLVHYGRLVEFVRIAGKELRMLDLEEAVLSNIEGNYYAIEVAKDTLRVALIPPDDRSESVRVNIAEIFKNQFGLNVEIISIPKESVSELVRSSLKPSMKNILITKE